MNLQEGIEFALSGKSILFVGAGYSVDAQNLRGVSFKTGKKLARHLAELSGITGFQLDEISLDDAAEEYISAHGKDKLFGLTSIDLQLADDMEAILPNTRTDGRATTGRWSPSESPQTVPGRNCTPTGRQSSNGE
jgi:hypothetical protein